MGRPQPRLLVVATDLAEAREVVEPLARAGFQPRWARAEDLEARPPTPLDVVVFGPRLSGARTLRALDAVAPDQTGRLPAVLRLVPATLPLPPVVPTPREQWLRSPLRPRELTRAVDRLLAASGRRRGRVPGRAVVAPLLVLAGGVGLAVMVGQWGQVSAPPAFPAAGDQASAAGGADPSGVAGDPVALANPPGDASGPTPSGAAPEPTTSSAASAQTSPAASPTPTAAALAATPLPTAVAPTATPSRAASAQATAAVPADRAVAPATATPPTPSGPAAPAAAPRGPDAAAAPLAAATTPGAVATPPAAVDPGAPPARPAAATGVYTVQPGDTLWALAIARGTTVEELVWRNGLSDPDLILIGQELVLPE